MVLFSISVLFLKSVVERELVSIGDYYSFGGFEVTSIISGSLNSLVIVCIAFLLLKTFIGMCILFMLLVS